MLQATLLDLMDRGVIVYEQQGNEVVLTRKSHGHVDDFERSFMNMALGIKFPVLLTVSLRIMNSVMMYTNMPKKQIKMRFVH